MKITGKRIRDLRKHRGVSAETLAESINVSPATIYRYENGDIEKVPTSTLAAIAEKLGTTPGYLMGWDQDDNKETPEYRTIQRRAKKMSPKNQRKLLQMMDIAFNDFDDEDKGDDRNE